MPTTLVDVDTLARHLGEPDRIVLDCRFSLADPAAGERAFAASRIPGARYLHLERDLSGPIVPGTSGRHPLPDPDALTARLAALGVGHDSRLVAYDDRVGAMAARLWWLVRLLGHEDCAVLDGGFAAWCAADLPLERGEPPHAFAPGDFARRAPLERSVDMARVAAGGLRLLDAREPARHAGAHEPIDPVAGRIPGALNHPFTDNVDADGRFLSPRALRARFAASLGQGAGVAGDTAGSAGADAAADAPPLVHYCGSGVTAAHNVLAMTHAGLPAGALYAGSFSEWITRHPVETDAPSSS